MTARDEMTEDFMDAHTARPDLFPLVGNQRLEVAFGLPLGFRAVGVCPHWSYDGGRTYVRSMHPNDGGPFWFSNQ